MRGIHSTADLEPNLTDASVSTDTSSHGTHVSAIIAAVGDNGEGIAGIMWDAALRPFDVSSGGRVSLADALVSIGVAADLGVRVLNFSAGYDWQVLRGEPPDPTSAADSQVVREVASQAEHAVAELLIDDPSSIPLIILSAGNNGIDAFWSGLPQIASAFPEHVLVVGAGRRMRPADGMVELAPFSNDGNLVEIAAPGQDVPTLDRHGQIVSVDGTSFAAPFVTGAAGLLLSFDSGIPNTALKSLILAGAREGGRRARGRNSYPLLNIYESLKLASRRDGAPLCGSRVVSDDRTVMVERDNGWEDLFDMNGSWGRLNVPHGSSILDTYVLDLDSRLNHADRFSLDGDSWILNGNAPSIGRGAADGSVRNSMNGVSHSGDSAAIIRKGGTITAPTFTSAS